MKDKLIWRCQNALEEAGIIRCYDGASVATVKIGLSTVEFIYPGSHASNPGPGPDWSRDKMARMGLLRFVQATRSLLQGASTYKACDGVYNPSIGTETKGVLFNHDVFCAGAEQPQHVDVSDVTVKEENIDL